ncbi:unnamed protein product [Cochlearia groenlandica]
MSRLLLIGAARSVRNVECGGGCGRIRRRFSSEGIARPPYMLLPYKVVVDSRSGGKVVNLNYYDPAKKETVRVPNQTIPDKLNDSSFMGSSRGWIIKGISLSSFPDQDSSSSCTVAVKWGSSISLCELGGEGSSWTHHLDLPCRLADSGVLYSERDSVFYITPNTELFSDDTGSFPSSSSLSTQLSQYTQLGPLHMPNNISESESQLLEWCIRINHLVESPYGDSFIVRCFVQISCDGKPIPFWELAKDQEYKNKKEGCVVARIKSFTVHKRDEAKGCELFTQDIGDLCIFFGMNELFCVKASTYPELVPNSIYFIDAGRVYNFHLATHTSTQLAQPNHLTVPYWLPPNI